MTSKLEIINAAYVDAGIDPLDDLTDETREGDYARARYEPAARRAMSSHPWVFCREMAEVTQPVLLEDGTDDVPLARYGLQYDWPERAEVIHAVLVDDAPIVFDLYGRRILCDQDGRLSPLVVDYGWRAPEELWPPFFESYFILNFASLAAGGIREDNELSAGLLNKAVAELRTARWLNAKQRTTKRLGRSRLANLRVAR